ncbi:hypothetical protein ACP70R_042305 [Stipagrostis hirtigluma subsp. patula]
MSNFQSDALDKVLGWPPKGGIKPRSLLHRMQMLGDYDDGAFRYTWVEV